MLCCCIRMLDVSSLLLLWVVFDRCARSAPAVHPQCARSAKFGPWGGFYPSDGRVSAWVGWADLG